MPPKGIYFNFLGFCVGAFRMAKKGDKFQIVDSNDKPKKRRIRRKKIAKKTNSYGSTDETYTFKSSTSEFSQENKIDESSCPDIENTIVFNRSLESEEYSISNSSTAVAAGIPPQPISGDIEEHNDFFSSNPKDNWERLDSINLDDDDEYEYVTDDETIDNGNKNTSTFASAQTGPNCVAISVLILAILLIFGPILSFLITGIIFLVADKAVCEGTSLLWVFGIVFMCTFFPTAFIVPNYKWGALVWSLLFIFESFILYYPHVICDDIRHTNLFKWSLCAYWFLFVHLIVSLAAFIASFFIIKAPEEITQAIANEEIKEAISALKTPIESAPLVGKNLGAVTN